MFLNFQFRCFCLFLLSVSLSAVKAEFLLSMYLGKVQAVLQLSFIYCEVGKDVNSVITVHTDYSEFPF